MLSFRPLRLAAAVSYTVQRLDHVEAVVNRLELLAKALDVTVDGPVVNIDLLVIGRIHQSIAALHHAGTLCKGMKNKELCDRQRDGLAFPGAGVTLLIHDQLATLQRTARLSRRLGAGITGARPAQDCTDAFNQ